MRGGDALVPRLEIDAETTGRLPNLMLIGYLIRVLEERIAEGETGADTAAELRAARGEG